jgi:hypothetical protein
LGGGFAQKKNSNGCVSIFAIKKYSSIKIGNDRQSSIFGEEMNIADYHFFVQMTKQKHGEDSEQYKSIFPDTAKFKEWYGFSFFEWKCSATRKSEKLYLIKRYTLPMVTISHEQAMAFCQWWEDIHNNSKNSKFICTYTLPTKSDYETVFNSGRAKITQRKALSSLQRRESSSRVYGLTDNVAEYMQDGMVVEGGENATLKFVEAKDCENPIGFRIKATIVSKK